MIDVFYNDKDTPYVWASDLHKLLNIKTPLSLWFPRMIEYGFTEDNDYFSDNKYVDSANSIKKGESCYWACYRVCVAFYDGIVASVAIYNPKPNFISAGCIVHMAKWRYR